MPPVNRTFNNRLARVFRALSCRPAGVSQCQRHTAMRTLVSLLLVWMALPSAAQQAPTPGCAQQQAQRAVQGVQHELQRQGLAIWMRCTDTPKPSSWAVEVRVVDGWRASAVVRGPLADGEVLDMGTTSGEWVHDTPAQVTQRYSPDVQHNRVWLQAVMARHHFASQPGGWWHYAFSAVTTDGSGATPLAMR